MDGTRRRRWLRWANVIVLVVVGVLGVGAATVPANAADVAAESGGVLTSAGPVVTVRDLPATNRVDVITGMSRSAAAGADMGVHPMLMIIGGVLAGFALVIAAVFLLPLTRRRRTSGLYLTGMDYRQLCVAARGDHSRMRHFRS